MMAPGANYICGPWHVIKLVHNLSQGGPGKSGPSRGGPCSLSSACGTPWIGESVLGSPKGKGEKKGGRGDSVMGHPTYCPTFK